MQLKDIGQNQPAPPIPGWFIKKLVQRFGRNRYREPNIILEWGMEPTKLVDGQLHIKAEYLKYRAHVCVGLRESPGTRILEKVVQPVEIGIPRWFACEWWPAALLDRNNYDEKMFGEFPSRGQYRSFLRLDDPDTGDYMAPSERMFTIIETVWAKRDRMRQLHSMEENDTTWQEKQELRAELDEHNKHWDAFWKRFEEDLYCDIRPHMGRLLTSTPNKGRGY